MADDGSAGAERDARIAALEAALAERDAKIAELVDQVAKLVSQLEKLTEQLSQNSKNSHLPPSSDGPGSRGESSGTKKPKSDRKRGGQKGHKGSHRELVPAGVVDTFIELFPDVCLGCARDLPRTFDADARRYQPLAKARMVSRADAKQSGMRVLADIFG